MKTHTTALKNALKSFPLESIEEITYGNTTLDDDNIVDIQFYFNGNLLKSMMKGLTIECDRDIVKDTIIRYRKGIKVATSYEYLDYGNFVVTKSEKKEDSNTYIITCYDKLVYSAVDYVDLGITYPITIADYLEAICTYLGLTLKTKIFENANKQIPSELYLNLGYKFRDVFDEISQATGTSICLDINDEVELRTPTTTNDTIDEDFILDINAKFGEKYGPVNSIVLSRSAESDNVYYKDDESIAQNGLCELKIIDNQIMNDNDRSDYLQGIANNVFGIYYYKNDFTTQGIFYYEFLDKYTISIDNNNYSCLMLNDDVIVGSGSENIYSDISNVSETDYSKSDKTDKRINKAYVLVDKMKGEIEAKVDKDGIIASLNLAVEDNQGIVTIRGNNFILETDNASIDKYGNTELENVKVRGGSLELQDDGTQENAGLKIDTLYKREDNIVNGVDLSDKNIVFHFKNKTYNNLIAYNGITLISDNNVYPWPLTLNCYTNDDTNEQFMDIIVTEIPYDTPDNPTQVILKTIKFENGIIAEDFYCLNPLGELMQIFYIIDDPIMNDIKYLSVDLNKKTTYSGYGIEADINIQDTASNFNTVSDIRDILDGVIQPTNYYLQGLDFDRDGVITENDYDIAVAYDNADIYWPDEKGHLSINTEFPLNNIVGVDGNDNEIFNFGIGTGGYVKDFKADTIKLNGNNINNVFVRKPVELYHEANGSATEITLNDDVSNYSRLEIFYGWQGRGFGLTSVIVDLSTSNIINMTCHALNNNQLYIASSQWTVNTNNNKVTPTKSEYWVLKTNGYPSRTTTAMVYIFKVVGYY